MYLQTQCEFFLIIFVDQYQTTTIMESPNENPTQETETPQDRHECLLQLMSSPELQQSFTVKDVQSCYHISYFNQTWFG